MASIRRYRDSNANLRTQLNRIIKAAGLMPWPKLFHNLRSTRQTELARTYPIHVVCEWIGNSQAIAAKHYLQTTDEHFASAANEPTGALHKALPKTAEVERTEAHEKSDAGDYSPDVAPMREYALSSVVREGLAQSAKTTGTIIIDDVRAAFLRVVDKEQLCTACHARQLDAGQLIGFAAGRESDRSVAICQACAQFMLGLFANFTSRP